MDKEAIFGKLEGLIKDYGPNRLSRDSGVSRQGIYRLMSEKNPRFETLQKIATALKIDLDLTRKLPAVDEIYSSLKFYGAPISTQPTETPLPLEDTLAQGIALSRMDGFVSSIIPYLLTKKADELNAPHLIALCDSIGESQTLGYYADIANMLKPNRKLSRLTNLLSDLTFRQEILSKKAKPTESFKRLAKAANNPIAKKWKLLTIDNLEHHLERYRKWLTQE
jgi:transcriptional regulator with XRE-family HTH domain